VSGRLDRHRGWGDGLGLVALVLALAAAPAPAFGDFDDDVPEPGPVLVAPGGADAGLIEMSNRACVVADPQASPDDEGVLQACRLMPGCRAIWQEGTGFVLILDFAEPAEQ
jgi:hypothetical protein